MNIKVICNLVSRGDKKSTGIAFQELLFSFAIFSNKNTIANLVVDNAFCQKMAAITMSIVVRLNSDKNYFLIQYDSFCQTVQ